MLAGAGHEQPRWTPAALRSLAGVAAGLDLDTAADEPLDRHTSMGVGGPTPLMIWPRRPSDVMEICRWTAGRGLGCRVLGGGSNLLVADAGVREPVLNTGRLTDGDRLIEDRFRAAAGTPTARILRATATRGYDGMIWSAGLPGSIGGAAAGNAGCWGSDMAASTASIEVIDAEGHDHVVGSRELRWSYRQLELPSTVVAPWFVVAVTVRLRAGDPAALESRYLDLQRRKRERQPIGARNSGCVFRNPSPAQAAGELLDRAGCKELRVGAAEVSARHANFIVNRGGASSADVTALVEQLIQRVRDHAGVVLRPEIRRW